MFSVTASVRARRRCRYRFPFHLPKSTLLMLVSAFAGMEPIRKAYRVAVQERMKFFSYGDCMLITGRV